MGYVSNTRHSRCLCPPSVQLLGAAASHPYETPSASYAHTHALTDLVYCQWDRDATASVKAPVTELSFFVLPLTMTNEQKQEIIKEKGRLDQAAANVGQATAAVTGHGECHPRCMNSKADGRQRSRQSRASSSPEDTIAASSAGSRSRLPRSGESRQSTRMLAPSSWRQTSRASIHRQVISLSTLRPPRKGVQDSESGI